MYIVPSFFHRETRGESVFTLLPPGSRRLLLKRNSLLQVIRANIVYCTHALNIQTLNVQRQRNQLIGTNMLINNTLSGNELE